MAITRYLMQYLLGLYVKYLPLIIGYKFTTQRETFISHRPACKCQKIIIISYCYDVETASSIN